MSRIVKEELHLQAHIAISLAGGMAGVNMIHDGDERLSPKVIATRACDIAQQMVAEFIRREWLSTVDGN